MSDVSNIEICKLALDMLGSSTTLNDLFNPSTPIERKCARQYPQCRNAELAKRRWTFAKRRADLVPDLTENAPEAVGKVRFALPADFLRLWRGDEDQWERAGPYLFAARATTLPITYTAVRPESEWSPLFVDVMTAAMAKRLVEYATKSDGLEARLKQDYLTAVASAAKANAFEIGPENINGQATSWDFERWV